MVKRFRNQTMPNYVRTLKNTFGMFSGSNKKCAITENFFQKSLKNRIFWHKIQENFFLPEQLKKSSFMKFNSLYSGWFKPSRSVLGRIFLILYPIENLSFFPKNRMFRHKILENFFLPEQLKKSSFMIWALLYSEWFKISRSVLGSIFFIVFFIFFKI